MGMIRSLRIGAGLTAEDLAAACGVTVAWVRLAEAGECAWPSPIWQQAMATVVAVRVE